MALHKLQNYLLLALFSLLLFVPGIAKMPVIDRDEAHFAQATRQMLQTGNYFQIRFQEKTRFQKPPGINWLQATFVKVFSNADATSIWPYRVPSLLGALFSVLLTYFFSRRFVGERVAKLAAALLASTLLLVVETHMAVIDSSLLSSVLLMQGALWIIYQEGMDNKKAHWGWALCFWLAMAYGLVLKGVTPLIGILSISTLCLIERRIDWLRGLRLVRGLLLFFVLSIGWLYLVNSAENTNYLMQMIHKDLLPKLKGGHESHGKPPLFHLAILLVTFWPASLFLWQAGVYAFRHRQEKIVRFLLAWLIPTWFFFEIMPTKLPQYVLPTFPVIALFCSLAVVKGVKHELPSQWLRFLQTIWGIFSIGLALGLASLPYLLLQQLTFTSIILFTEISLLTLVALYFAWFGIYRRAIVTILSMALITYPLIFSSLLPQLKPIWLAENLAKRVDQSQISTTKPLLVVGFEEPSLVFNLNTALVKFVDIATAEVILKSDRSRLAVVDSAIFNNLIKDQVNLIPLDHIKGFNYSKGRWVELILVRQDPGGEN